MLASYMQSVYPGPSSQTTSVQLENLIEDSGNLSFSDAYTYSPPIQVSGSWEEEANKVLQEHAELWERLSKL
jgi:hypothetical protein